MNPMNMSQRCLLMILPMILWLALGVPPAAHAQVTLWSPSSFNYVGDVWPAGTWSVRAILLDAANAPIGGSTGFTLVSGPPSPLAWCSAYITVTSATPAHKVRVFRKIGSLNPGDTGVQFAEFSCNNGGNLAAICDPSLNSLSLPNAVFTSTGTLPQCPPGNVLYVDDSATGSNDGSSWANAIPNLQSAFTRLCPGITQVWVAEGTYKPTTSTDRNATFQLVNGLALYGGFAGTETLLSQRNVSAHVTMLSGDIGILLTNNDNSYHVVTGSGTDSTAVIDGFTINRGNADGGATTSGGGMSNLSGSPTVENCRFIDNNASLFGGGMHNRLGSAVVRNCVFGGVGADEGNTASASGGGVYNETANPTIEGCEFIQNTANNNGGAMDNADGSNVVLRDCLFQDNTALRGGGVHAWISTVELENCRFEGNSSTDGGGGMNAANNSVVTLQACDLVGNSANSGGGMRVVNSVATVLGSNFEGNTANFGGAMRLSSNSDATLLDCNFEDNEALGDGGGLNLIGGSDATFRNCRFFSNVAQGSLASGGTPPFGGGAIAWFSASGALVNCTMVANEVLGNDPSDGGGGLMVSGSTVDVVNSILWGNTAVFGSTEDEQIHVNPAASSTLSVNHSDVQGWTGALGGSGNIGADPRFFHPGVAGNLRLTPGSPAIDAGDSGVAGLPATDLDGNARIVEVAVDMGAYETAYAPDVLSIVDIGNDQGRLVRLTFGRSSLDAFGSVLPITQYVVFRRIDPLPLGAVIAGLSLPAAVSLPVAQSMPEPDLAYLASPGWDFVATVPAFGQTQYSLVVPTLADSTIAHGQHWSAFFVRGATSIPVQFTDAAPDSGYSLDNLAPGVPQGFVISGDTEIGNTLSWHPSLDADFHYFRIYRAQTADVPLQLANVLTQTAGTSYVDDVANPAEWFYRITAVDHSGNESAATGMQTPTDSPVPMLPTVTALHQNEPNPFNPVTRIGFDLARGGDVRLHIYDATGRRVRTLVQEHLPARRHEAIWNGQDDAGRRVASGTYVYMLVSGDYRATQKLVLLK